STTVRTSWVNVEPSVTLPAALIATPCPTITLAMSADLLMSPMDTCKFGVMGPSTRLRSFVSYKRGHFVSSLKRQSQNPSAAIASCAKQKDSHDRTSNLATQANKRSCYMVAHHIRVRRRECPPWVISRR